MGQNYKGEKRELRIRSEKRTSRPEWWLDKAATGTEEDLEAPFSETVATGIKSSRSRSLSLVLISVLVFFFLSPLWFWDHILVLFSHSILSLRALTNYSELPTDFHFNLESGPEKCPTRDWIRRKLGSDPGEIQFLTPSYVVLKV